MGGVDVGVLATPAPGRRGEVGGPKGVPPAVGGLEQGELCAGVRPLAAGEDAHRSRPAGEFVPASVAQQGGELGDLGFLDPAFAVPALAVRARGISAALADLAAAVDSGLLRRCGSRGDGPLLTVAQVPPD